MHTVVVVVGFIRYEHRNINSIFCIYYTSYSMDEYINFPIIIIIYSFILYMIREETDGDILTLSITLLNRFYHC